MELVLAKSIVRSWRPEDVPSLAQHANNRNVWLTLRDRFPHPYSEADARAWIVFAIGTAPETHFAIEVAGQAVGAIGFEIQSDVYRRSAEIGYWLGEAYWGRGIMTGAVRALTDYAFREFDLCRLFAGVFESNPASARVLEKAGYVLEGRLRRSVTKAGRTLDQLVYALVR